MIFKAIIAGIGGCLLGFHLGFAQTIPTPQHFQITSYRQFPDADAVVLHDKGKFYFEGYTSYLSRTVRIQILSEKGLDQADVELSYYREDDTELISQVKATTYNLVNGKVVFTGVKGKDIHTEKLDDSWSQIRFSFPQAQVGSIIEYEYLLKSTYVVTPRSWNFQSSLPTLVSEFQFLPPDQMSYVYLFPGTMRDQIKEIGKYHWKLTDIPALREEPYVTTLSDYRQKMSLQLVEYYQNGRKVTVLKDWKEFSEDLLKSDGLGKRLKRNKFLSSLAQSLAAPLAQPEEKLEAIYSHVQENLSWNGENRIFAERDLEKVYESGEGSSAEIHLILTFLLREAGLSANPLIISTRDHGRLIVDYPLISQFNQLLCHVQIGEKEFILNSTHPLQPYTLPDHNDLNSMGWLLRGEGSEWLTIPANFASERRVMTRLALDETGNLEGSVQEKMSGYRAIRAKTALIQKGEDEYLQEYILSHLPDGEAEWKSQEGLEENTQPLDLSYELSSPDFVEAVGDYVYLSPMLWFGQETNPFLSPQRSFPVDFGYKRKFIYQFNLQLPSGYEVESLPKSTSYKFPDNSVRFIYQAQQSGPMIQMISQLEINESLLQASEYELLRKLFDGMLEKQGEKIILKRKS